MPEELLPHLRRTSLIKPPDSALQRLSFSSNTPVSSRSVANFAAKPRGDVGEGVRVFQEKFGYSEVGAQDGNKLEIEFEQAGRKRVIVSFVRVGEGG